MCLCNHINLHTSILSLFYTQWKWLLEYRNNCMILHAMTENEARHDKTNKIAVRPANTQISLGIRPVWSESLLCINWVAKEPSFLYADSEDSICQGWSESSLGAQSLCWFCHVAAQTDTNLNNADRMANSIDTDQTVRKLHHNTVCHFKKTLRTLPLKQNHSLIHQPHSTMSLSLPTTTNV